MRSRSRSRLLLVAPFGVCFAIGAVTSPAVSAEIGMVNDDATAPPLLEFSVVGELGASDALSVRILSWFRGLPTLTSASHVAALEPSAVFQPRERPGVRVWALSRSPELLRLFFAVEGVGDRPRYLVRDVALDSGLDELGMERVAQVVYLSALALWSGQLESTRRDVELGLDAAPRPVPEPPTSAPEAPVPARRSRSLRLAAGFEYSGRYAGAAGLSHGPGATLALMLPAEHFEWGPRLHGQLLLPQREDGAGIRLELRGTSFAFGLSAETPIGSKNTANLELGAGVDAVRFRVLSLPEPALRANSSALDWRPFTYARVGVDSDVGFLRVGAFALLAVSLVRTHYDVVDGDARREILVPWLLQPGFGLRAAW